MTVCIFSQPFKWQKQAVCVDRRLWDSAVCLLLIVFISSSFPKQQAGYSGPLWDTESHWQRGHPSSTCCICLYLLLLQYPHISFHSLACFSSASFLSYETHCSLLWDGISSLWVQTAMILVVRCNWDIKKGKRFASCDVPNTKIKRRLWNPAEIVQQQNRLMLHC